MFIYYCIVLEVSSSVTSPSVMGGVGRLPFEKVGNVRGLAQGYKGDIGMCGPRGFGFSVVLVINRELILVI